MTVRERIFAVAREVASRLGTPADDVIAGFLDCLATSADNVTAATTISSTSVPLEVSFTGRPGDERALRLLAEPIEPGGGAVGRCFLGINALVGLLERFAAYREPALVGQVVADVLPPGGERTALSWSAAVWLALRTNGRSTGIRAYVNLHNRPVGNRYLRAIGVLDHLGLAADACGVRRIASMLGSWAAPIGMSLDFAAGTVRTARLHFNAHSLSYRRLSMLVSEVELNRLGDIIGFLEPFGITPGGSAHPLLLSVGLEGSCIESVKFDVSVSAMPPASATGLLGDLERHFGTIAGRHLAADLFADPSLLRYVGLTVSRLHEPYLNVYYSAPELPFGAHARSRVSGHASSPTLTTRGLGFVRTQWVGDHVMRAEARSTGALGSTAAKGVADLLVTSLIEAQYRQLWPQLSNVSERDPLPRLRHGGLAVRAQEDGGLSWSSDGQRGPSDPTATLCVLADVFPIPDVGWDPERTRAYLHRWFYAPASPRFPACPDGCRSLLPLYLAAASRAVEFWYGPRALELIRAEVLGRRRDDGTWGLGGPESLETALAVLTLDILDEKFWSAEPSVGYHRELVEFFASVQYPDGGWCWAPLLCDGLGTWFGHRAVTTMIVIRALTCLRLRAGANA